MDNCPICRKNSLICGKKELKVEIKLKKGITSLSPIFEYECKVCGKYRIDNVMEQTLIGNTDVDRRYILSGITRQRSEQGVIITITNENYDKLLDSAPLPDGPLESMDRILIYLEEHTSHAAEFKKLNADTHCCPTVLKGNLCNLLRRNK